MEFDAYESDSEEDYNAFVDWLSESTVEQLRQAGTDTEAQKVALRRYFQLGYKAHLSPSELWDFLAIDSGCVLESVCSSEEEIERAVELSQIISQQVIRDLEET